MRLTNLSVVVLLLSVAGWWLVERWYRSGAHRRNGTLWRVLSVYVARVGLVFAVLVAHMNLLDWVPGGRLVATAPITHYHETFHYYLGARYFAELGYTGLYHAVVLADLEDTPSAYKAREWVRDLSTNRTVPRSKALRSTREIRAAFSNERWESFKRDVAVHREASTPKRWSLAVRDHGYNGTPLVTALLGWVASQPWIPTAQFLSYVVVLDLILIVLFCVFVGMREGMMLALSVLFFTFANPLNDYSFIGASYLRYGYFLALAGALLALRGNRLVTSGALLAVAGWMRIFPLAIYGFLLLRDVVRGDWRESLRASRRLHVSFAVATIAILAGTSLLNTPDGRNPWLSFADNIRTHADMTGVNQVNLATPLNYTAILERLSAEPGLGDGAQSPGRPNLKREISRIRSERTWIVRAVTVVFLVFALAALRRSASRTAVLIPSLLAIFCVLPMTHYYWSMLSLLPLALPNDSRMHKALLVLFAALALTAARDLFPGYLSLRFTLMSVELLIFLLYCCFALCRNEPRSAKRSLQAGPRLTGE
jgi:hypothetical protein